MERKKIYDKCIDINSVPDILWLNVVDLTKNSIDPILTIACKLQHAILLYIQKKAQICAQNYHQVFIQLKKCSFCNLKMVKALLMLEW